MPFLKILILSGLFISTAAAEIDFKTIETPACTFRLSKIELTALQQEGITFGVECIQKTYEDLLGFSYPENFKVKVVLFKEKNDFLSYQRKTIGKIASESGYYAGEHAEAVTWLQDDIKQMVAVLFHEASHMLLRNQVPWCPDWINEGIAEYFGSLNLFDGKLCICLQETRMDWCKYWLKHGFPVEFETFFAMDRDAWRKFDKANNNAGYTIGYSITYFLMTNAKTKSIMKEIIWDFKRNKYNADSVATINQYYPGGIKALELHWKRWIPRARRRKPLKALIDKSERKPAAKKDEISGSR